MPGLWVAVPVRNGGCDLDDFLDTLDGRVEGVVALDDGSTDDTARRLAAHPLVKVLLRNPVRGSYAGWDDRANRQALIDACGDVAPDWVLQLDADERLPARDADALRRAVDHGALDPSCAYLLRVLRMVDGPDGYDEDSLWVGRLFAWRPGMRLPAEQLHLVPVPDDIPQERWVRTTLRILHYGSTTPARRQARFTKYAEADPENRWQTDYEGLLAAPTQIRRLPERSPCLPVVPNDRWPDEAVDADLHPPESPVMTAVVISRDDEAIIERAVAAVVAQECPWPVQVVVVVSGTDGTADIVRERFPDVELVVLDRPALPGEARNAGLARARGRYITFPGSHITLPRDALAARVRAHRRGWALVSGVTYNGTGGCAGWASYFLDHAGALPDRPSHQLIVAPSSCSYLTSALRAVGGFPEDMRTAEDTVANNELFRLGYGGWREQAVTMVHHSPCTTVRRLIRHHHARGRGLGQLLIRGTGPDRPLITRSRITSLGLRYVPGRLHRIHHYTWRYGGRMRGRWVAVAPLASIAVLAAWLGAWRELLRPRTGGLTALVGGSPPMVHLVRRIRRSTRHVRRSDE